jgi:hypothetical protein
VPVDVDDYDEESEVFEVESEVTCPIEDLTEIKPVKATETTEVTVLVEDREE